MSRSWLYVPGDRPDRIAKALAAAADAVIIDLEDAVKPEQKDEARTHAAAALDGSRSRRLWVRINADDEGRRDLAALAGSPAPDGLVLAKCERVEWIAEVADWRSGVALAPLVETATALRHLDPITSATNVECCHLGEIDLLADLGGRLPGGSPLLDHARVALVVASAASGIAPPIGGVHQQIDDLDALRSSSIALAELGFGGRAVIHPSHCAAANEAFSPSVAEVAWAHEVIALLTGADGAVRGPQGEMLDEAVARRARRILGLAGR